MLDLSDGSSITFSIIIPTYNASKTLENCINSIAGQTYKSWEIIIVDGVSTDGTIELLNRIASKFSQIKFLSEKDNGIYDAMNKGIDIARGSWIIFLGADDQLDNNNILMEVNELLNDTHARLLYGNAKLMGDLAWGKDGTIYDGPFTVRKLFKKNICHQAIFYHRTVFKQIGNYNTRYFVCADWDFNLRCFAKMDVEYIDLIVSKFHGGGFSTTYLTDDFNKESVIILKSYYQISFFNSLFSPYSWSFYFQANKAFKNKKLLQALRYLAFAFIHAENKLVLCRVLAGSILKRFKGFKQGTQHN